MTLALTLALSRRGENSPKPYFVLLAPESKSAQPVDNQCRHFWLHGEGTPSDVFRYLNDTRGLTAVGSFAAGPHAGLPPSALQTRSRTLSLSRAGEGWGEGGRNNLPNKLRFGAASNRAWPAEAAPPIPSQSGEIVIRWYPPAPVMPEPIHRHFLDEQRRNPPAVGQALERAALRRGLRH